MDAPLRCRSLARVITLALCAMLGTVALFPDPGRANDGPAITCGGSYSDLCFNCSSDEDNDCSSYSGLCGDPVGTNTDRILQLTTPTDAWVELHISWGSDEDMNFYVNEGGLCSPTIACVSGCGFGCAGTVWFPADSALTYNLAFDENQFGSFGDWTVGISSIACCFDSDGDGTYDPTDDACPNLAAGQMDCDDADPTIAPGATEFCDGKDNDCDTFIDEACVGAPVPATTTGGLMLLGASLVTSFILLQRHRSRA
jgi:hypothetical protein